MTTKTEASSLLDGEGWLNYVDNSENIDEFPAPLGATPFYRGAVTTLGAMTGVGKTVWGLQAWRWVVDSGVRACYMSLEMSPAQIFKKRFWQQFGSEAACREWIQDNDAHISHSYLDSHEVEKEIREGEWEMVFVDHIHELPFEGHEDFGRKIHRIASLAPETGTTIVLLSQMKQRDPDFDNSPPGKYDYSWTKAIPEVSAVCQALWLPDPDVPTHVELVTTKNRFGPLNPPVKLRLNRETITFESAR